MSAIDDKKTPSPFTYEVGGLPLMAWTLGPQAGRPVVMLHGFLDNGRSFAPMARHLLALATEPLRVIMPDHRGHGCSGHVGPGCYYHFPDYIRDLAGLYAALNLDRAAIVGHSMGASIAVYFAGTFPDRVDTLTLLDGIGPSHMPAAQGPRLFKRWLSDLAAAEQREATSMDDLEHVAARIKRMAPKASSADLRELALYASRAVTEGEDGQAAGLRRRWCFDPLHRTRAPMPFDRPRFDAFLEQIPCRTLALWGDHSPFKPADAEARIAKLAHVRQRVLTGAGHNLHHERPAELAALLWEHLRATEKTAAPAQGAS